MQTKISIGIVALVVGLALGVISERSFYPQKATDSVMVAGHSMDANHPTVLTMPDHTHVLKEIDQNLPIPSISISAVRDSKSGYNIQINTENFTFTPELAGKESRPNQGHAHVYVNDKKIMRMYNNWFHLPSDQLPDGTSTLLVTLNANDHSDWAFNGVGIGAEITLTK